MRKKKVIRNKKSTPKKVIIDQMLEPRPLPMGRTEYEEWSNRIISGSLVPHDKEQAQVFIESQKFALAGMLMHIGPTESHKPDAHFIHGLRVSAIKQVAHTMLMELNEAKNKRLAEKEAEEGLNDCE